MFLDEKGAGELSSRAKGIAGVVVSDGHELVRTDRDGNYALHTSPGRLVFVVLPTGYRSGTSFYQSAADGKQLNFPLIAWPESNHDAVRFAQITDIHISGRNAAGPFASDLEEINRYSPKVAFVLATGDLANSGKDTEFEDYCRAVAHLNVPLFNVVGNHDVIGGDANYPKYLGAALLRLQRGQLPFCCPELPGFRQGAEELGAEGIADGTCLLDANRSLALSADS